jgi:hypothetical protein
LTHSCSLGDVELAELLELHKALELLSDVHSIWILMHENLPDSLPRTFCWTRFGPEAGESFDEILVRKEAEREACDGKFYWGIGSAVGPALSALLAETDVPEILFSPISSAPRPIDITPSHVVRWSAGTGLFGDSVVLPPAACVTSRWDPARPNAARYALVCASNTPLSLEAHGELDFATLRNLNSGARVGASQVTAVVRRDLEDRPGHRGRMYQVALRARLVFPYLVRLSSRSPVGGARRQDERAAHGALLSLVL